jgi:hypothetical protein
MTTGSKSLRLADQLVREPYAWPGGYPLHAVTDDGGVMCRFCAEEEREWIALTNCRDGWCMVNTVINWEDHELRCDCCGKLIEAAYERED